MEQWRLELLEEHRWLVDRVLGSVWGRVPTAVGRDELRSSGLLGLVQAAGRFDPDSDVTFAAFAEFRVRGAMLDCVRTWDNLPRRLVELDRRIADAASTLRSASGSVPEDHEIAGYLGVEVAAIAEVREWRRSRGRSSLDDLATGDADSSAPLVDVGSEDAYDRVVHQQLLEQMTTALASLPPRHREVIEAIYIRGIAPRQVAADLRVTPTRVSQIRARALELLHQSMTPPPD